MSTNEHQANPFWSDDEHKERIAAEVSKLIIGAEKLKYRVVAGYNERYLHANFQPKLEPNGTLTITIQINGGAQVQTWREWEEGRQLPQDQLKPLPWEVQQLFDNGVRITGHPRSDGAFDVSIYDTFEGEYLTQTACRLLLADTNPDTIHKTVVLTELQTRKLYQWAQQYDEGRGGHGEPQVP